jgi:hypothetical protein
MNRLKCEKSLSLVIDIDKFKNEESIIDVHTYLSEHPLITHKFETIFNKEKICESVFTLMINRIEY